MKTCKPFSNLNDDSNKFISAHSSDVHIDGLVQERPADDVQVNTFHLHIIYASLH